MKKLMSRQQSRQLGRLADKKGAESRKVLDTVVDTIKDKIINAVKQVHVVALWYTLIEVEGYSNDDAKELVGKFLTAIEDFDKGVLSYETIRNEMFKGEEN